MQNGESRYTNHSWAEVPFASWGVPSKYPHRLNNGCGQAYTPHQAIVTESFVIVDGEAHPIERDVCRIVAVGAVDVTLVVGPDAPSTVLQDVLSKKLGKVPTAMLVGVYTRYVPGYELGRNSTADEVVGKTLKVGLPISLMETES